MDAFLSKSLLFMKLVLCCLGENKILGGREAKLTEFPFMASVGYRSDHLCGGVVMSVRHVLTACHCIKEVRPVKGVLTFVTKSPDMVTVVVGTVYLGYRGDTGVSLSAQALRAHPKCVKLTTGWVYDFGIIVIREQLKLIPGQIQVLQLPSFNRTVESSMKIDSDFEHFKYTMAEIIAQCPKNCPESKTNRSIAEIELEIRGRLQSLDKLAEGETKCQAMGWGATAEDSSEASAYLLEVDLELVHPDNCARLLKIVAERFDSDLRYNNESQLCTMGEDGKDACQGDSGGPLLCDNGFGKQILIAIVSWGIGCGRFETPGVWARLDVTEMWIREALLSGAPADHITFAINSVVTITIITMLHFTPLSCIVAFVGRC